MPTNDFKALAGSGGANVLTQADYAALTTILANGLSSGVVPSNLFNKILRQSSAIAAAVAQMVADNNNADVLDDGNSATLLSSLKTALSGKLINIQVFTNTGTYTPTPGMKFIIAEGVGGGGGGGGCAATAAGNIAGAQGGGSGAYGKGKFTAADIGASKAVTIGAAGSGGTASNGTAGGTTSLGALMSMPGGNFGGGGGASAAPTGFLGGASGGGLPSGANILASPGSASGPAAVGQNGGTSTGGFGGNGGSSLLGIGAQGTSNTNGGNSAGYGAGGGGTASAPGTGALTGGNGSKGVLIIYEFG